MPVEQPYLLIKLTNHYDPMLIDADDWTGEFDYPLSDGTYTTIKPARLSWYVNNSSKWRYARCSTERKGKRVEVFMHRMLLQCPKGTAVDHINHNTLDNRRCNLRLATNAENLANMSVDPDRGSSQFKGVSWDSGNCGWRVQIGRGMQKKNLGIIRPKAADICSIAEAEIEAALRYNSAAKEAFGDRAELNAIPDGYVKSANCAAAYRSMVSRGLRDFEKWERKYQGAPHFAVLFQIVDSLRRELN